MKRRTTRRKKAESPAKTPAVEPQKHGGVLLRGGNYGNKGGTGRPASEFRAACRELVDKYKLVDRFAEIARDSLDEKAAIQAGTKLIEWGWVELKKIPVDVTIPTTALDKLSREEIAELMALPIKERIARLSALAAAVASTAALDRGSSDD